LRERLLVFCSRFLQFGDALLEQCGLSMERGGKNSQKREASCCGGCKLRDLCVRDFQVRDFWLARAGQIHGVLYGLRFPTNVPWAECEYSAQHWWGK
jgi:hypothetical protein